MNASGSKEKPEGWLKNEGLAFHSIQLYWTMDVWKMLVKLCRRFRSCLWQWSKNSPTPANIWLLSAMWRSLMGTQAHIKWLCSRCGLWMPVKHFHTWARFSGCSWDFLTSINGAINSFFPVFAMLVWRWQIEKQRTEQMHDLCTTGILIYVQTLREISAF